MDPWIHKSLLFIGFFFEIHLFILSQLDDLEGQNIFPFTHRYTFRVLRRAHTYFPRELLFQTTLIFIERKYRKCEK